MMWYSGLPTCCGTILERGDELRHLPSGPRDWAISAPLVTRQTSCSTCGADWLYSRKPPPNEVEQARAPILAQPSLFAASAVLE